MKLYKSILAMMLTISMVAGCNSAGNDIAMQANSEGASYILVDFQDDVTPQEVAAIEEELGIDVVPTSDMYSRTKLTRLKIDISNEHRLADIIDSLYETELVEVLETEQYYSVPESEEGLAEASPYFISPWTFEEGPNDPLYQEGKQWNMTMIGVEKAWETTRGKGVIVAILDTGISTGKGKYPRVPDLKQTCMVEGRNFTRDGAVDDPYDFHGHGTHVGGTVAQSTNNGIGVVGVAYEACLMPVKVLGDRGSGSTAGIAEAIIWATDHGANVINMSLGGGGYSKVMDKALSYAAHHNVFVACAAGNAGKSTVEYPAAMTGCQAVSSVGKSGKLAFYSSYGTNGDGIFIAAPGGDQQADGKEGGVWQNTIVTGDPTKHGYFPFQGTSMATPHVAGAAALVISELGEKYKLRHVKDALGNTATKMDEVNKYGHGLMNVAQAVSVAKDTEDEDDSLSWFGWLMAMVIGFGVIKVTMKK